MPDHCCAQAPVANAPNYQGVDGRLIARILGQVERALASVLKDRLSVLEAGGGSASLLSDFGRRLEFTAIDISPEQLERNTYATKKVVGDLQAFDYGQHDFDLIVCWDVLEHLQAPTEAIGRMAAATSRNGVFVIKGPFPNSLKGLVTRWTPHRLHVLFYRWILANKKAGQPGYAPFPVKLRTGSEPQSIEQVLSDHGFVTIARHSFTTNQTLQLKQRLPLVHAAYKTAASLLSRLTGGAHGHYESDFCIIAQRQDGAKAVPKVVRPPD